MADIVDLYLEHGDFKTAVRLSGLPVHVAHLKLLKSGALQIQDKIRYGNKAAKLGGEAEALFQKLVPTAVDANRYFKKNHPVYDFMYGNLTIDVKYSSSRRQSSHVFWKVRVSGDQDFIVAFLEREAGQGLNNPIILLLPMSFIENASSLHISKGGPWIKEFQIEPEELEETLRGYSELREQGMF